MKQGWMAVVLALIMGFGNTACPAQRAGGVKRNSMVVKFHKKKHSRFKKNRTIHLLRWNNGKGYWDRNRKEKSPFM